MDYPLPKFFMAHKSDRLSQPLSGHTLTLGKRNSTAGTRRHGNLKRGEEEYYNKQAKPLPPLKIGQKVRLQDAVTRKWDRSGIIVGIGKNRDYHIRLPSGRVFWRNRRLLRLDFIEEPSDKRSTLEDKIRSKKNVRFDDDVEIQNIPPRRSKRHRRSPSRFQNFV